MAIVDEVQVAQKDSRPKHDFSAGDIVYLKSGGPAMTISSAGYGFSSALVHCVWFNSGKLECSDFDCAVLTRHLDRQMPLSVGIAQASA